MGVISATGEHETIVHRTDRYSLSVLWISSQILFSSKRHPLLLGCMSHLSSIRIGSLIEKKEERKTTCIFPLAMLVLFVDVLPFHTINYFMLVQFQMTPDLSLCLLYTQTEIDGLAPSTGTSLLWRRESCRDLCIHRMELIPLDMTCKYRSVEENTRLSANERRSNLTRQILQSVIYAIYLMRSVLVKEKSIDGCW